MKYAIIVIIISVSDDLKHDACLVREFQDKAHTIIGQSVEVRKLYEWTDSCAAQYKARSAFADISIQNIKLERNFFETSHGKSVCDSLGAVIKNCYQAVLTGKAVLSTADDVYSYCSRRLSHTLNSIPTYYITINSGKQHTSMHFLSIYPSINFSYC